MKTLIANALVIPMDREERFLIGDIGLDGPTIAFVGRKDSSFVPDRVIDAQGYIALPSLYNSHTHLAMGLMRNYKDNEPTLQAWLNEIFPIENKLVADDILIASRIGVIEALQSGTGHFHDMYFKAEATAQAVRESGMRAKLGLTLFGDLTDSKARVDRWDAKVLPSIDDSVTYSVAPHAIYTCSGETLRFAHDLAKERRVPLHIHLSETEKENDDCLSEHNKTPLQYLIDLNFFDGVSVFLAHCVHLSEEDQNLLKELPATVIHNPSSNLKLSSGIAPVATYLEKGIPVLLGTDGASSNNNLNLVEEMHLAALLGRLSSKDGVTLKPYQILEMATSRSAKAFGIKGGVLQAGFESDLILINTRKAHLAPLNDPFSALVYSTQGSDIEYLFSRGELLLEKGRPTRLDLSSSIEAIDNAWVDIKRR
ncbi:MAG TPA: amidohydrolase [Sphaerochaeta sp.]|nr:amidohydrolase [Sphaerochaeta sp.]HQB54379.1 amidohydrolase [Sphaerochaeta sp.]